MDAPMLANQSKNSIHQLCAVEKICQKSCLIGTDGVRESKESVMMMKKNIWIKGLELCTNTRMIGV